MISLAGIDYSLSWAGNPPLFYEGLIPQLVCSVGVFEDLLRKNGQDVVGSHYEELFILNSNLSSGEFGINHLIAGLNFHVDTFPVREHSARSGGHYFALLWALLGGIRQE
jgi:hypothetical protein